MQISHSVDANGIATINLSGPIGILESKSLIRELQTLPTNMFINEVVIELDSDTAEPDFAHQVFEAIANVKASGKSVKVVSPHSLVDEVYWMFCGCELAVGHDALVGFDNAGLDLNFAKRMRSDILSVRPHAVSDYVSGADALKAGLVNGVV